MRISIKLSNFIMARLRHHVVSPFRAFDRGSSDVPSCYRRSHKSIPVSRELEKHFRLANRDSGQMSFQGRQEAVDVLDVAGVAARQLQHSAAGYHRHQVVDDGGQVGGRFGPLHGQHGHVMTAACEPPGPCPEGRLR